ncbi:bifunctional diguanylate cyclase/phosphodiesterase [Aureimonas sp. AU12]|uniref:putative bifunctional diguanylate cyclase/phosphodiesterase n=1 Tax=Aureimonas sp. AU12 TaxID=1638161 RepID=UPI000AF6F9EE|nr:bifunctional diguanylate cyclase/phosphodiesterase [Aureimonas sp. AU12]
MILRLVRKYMLTAIGATIVVATIASAGAYLGARTIDQLVSISMKRRGESFARFLVENDSALYPMLTGISRDTDAEAKVRSIATASGIDSFSIFDVEGREVFTLSSQRHSWLMRERPGGTVTGDRLSETYVRRTGPWIEVEGLSTDTPAVVVPLEREGRRVGFLTSLSNGTAIRATFTQVLTHSASLFVFVTILATGIPGLIYLRRKRRIEQADEHIQFLANFDTLTHLYNRRRMQDECERILATSRATRERLAFWSLDIERMGDITNGFGQAVGDEVLRTVAKRLSIALDKNDLVGRLGADDFVLLQRNALSIDAVEALAKRIRRSVETPMEVEGHTIVPRLCIGVAMIPDHGRVYNEVARHADLALLVHKSSKLGDFIAYDPSMDEEAVRRRSIEARVREAITSDGFELFYQPIVCGSTHEPLGFEALIRLPTGDGQFISPADFIPIAEARGYIKEIGSWVIRQATRQLALWPDHLFISVNLSAVQFRDGDLVDIVAQALRDSGIAGHRLEIEVVESLLLDRSDLILDQLSALKRLGVSIAMDDFGTGYSSLGYLWRFPFDKLKIDQSFMLAFGEGEANVSQIIETIVSLGHHMGMKVTTEGVETADQVAALSAMGCDQLQGYHFGRPQPVDRIASEMLKQTSARGAAFHAAPVILEEAVAVA